MAFKLLILCFALLIATNSASSVCKCGPEKKDSVAKYTFKMSENGTDYDEDVEIDGEKETETFHVPKISPDKDSGDVIYDFKRNLTMIRMTEAKACFLSKSTFDVPKPADLQELLKVVTRDGMKVTPRSEVKLKVVSTLDDRSELSDEMANLCSKLPIHEVAEGEVDLSRFNKITTVRKLPATRVRRGLLSLICSWVCNTVCKTGCHYVCTATLCSYVCKPVCEYGCSKICD